MPLIRERSRDHNKIRQLTRTYPISCAPRHTHRDLAYNELQTLPSEIFDGLGSMEDL